MEDGSRFLLPPRERSKCPGGHEARPVTLCCTLPREPRDVPARPLWTRLHLNLGSQVASHTGPSQSVGGWSVYWVGVGVQQPVPVTPEGIPASLQPVHFKITS